MQENKDDLELPSVGKVQNFCKGWRLSLSPLSERETHINTLVYSKHNTPQPSTQFTQASCIIPTKPTSPILATPSDQFCLQMCHSSGETEG